ncbi:hypothetical protein T190_08505 [Sinorhizobium meliloti CCBAU 01290]|nr:hypothetical protein T190_08505 [Sinorhizobium meliloti CCBAU 01290]
MPKAIANGSLPMNLYAREVPLRIIVAPVSRSRIDALST